LGKLALLLLLAEKKKKNKKKKEKEGKRKKSMMSYRFSKELGPGGSCPRRSRLRLG